MYTQGGLAKSFMVVSVTNFEAPQAPKHEVVGVSSISSLAFPAARYKPGRGHQPPPPHAIASLHASMPTQPTLHLSLLSRTHANPRRPREGGTTMMRHD